MKTLRMIKVKENGEVDIDPKYMNEPIGGQEAGIQRVVIALLTTPHSMSYAPNWGGGGRKLFLKRRGTREQMRALLQEIVHRTQTSVKKGQNPDDPYRVKGISLGNVDFNPRGLDIELKVNFEHADTKNIRIPVGTNAEP